MYNRSKQQSLDDRLDALERFERRKLLLRLSTVRADDRAGISVGGPTRGAGDLDPLVAMRHLHLPTLEEAGFIRWDRENDRVTKGPRFEEVEPLLHRLREVREDLPDGWV